MLIVKQFKEKKLKAEQNRKVREGLIKEQTQALKENDASVFI
jgi:hypothetical protein